VKHNDLNRGKKKTERVMKERPRTKPDGLGGQQPRRNAPTNPMNYNQFLGKGVPKTNQNP
jgi:hypothetical protein